MSLLLDALKKAADDKQKAEKDNSSAESVATELAATAIVDSDVAEVTLLSEGASIDTDELTLELDALEPEITPPPETDYTPPGQQPEKQPEQQPVPQPEASNAQQASDIETAHKDENEGEQEAPTENYQVSDEALSMLINKTNREVKLGRRLFVLSALLITLLILLSGGAYYYTVTQDEIASLERKHRISMSAMKEKTSSEKEPDNVEVIRNLVSDADLEKKVEFAKQRLADKNQIKQEKRPVTQVAKKEEKTDKMVFSIQKTNKTDPVAEMLDIAWLAYDEGDLITAKQEYQSVIALEKSNRDALLGLAAIAVAEKDDARASEMYMALLAQDPRDPIALAALSSLHQDGSSLKNHEQHLIKTLEKTPDAAPLNFALGNVYAQQGNWKAAQQAYFNAWQYDADNANYLFNLAVSMDQLGEHQQAMNFYINCLQQAKNKQVSFSREAVQQRINDLSEL